MTTSRKQKKPVAEKQTNSFADVSAEKASIISVVRSLEVQVETAFKLKGILQDQLDALQKRLTDERAARAESEEQLVKRLEDSEASKEALEMELVETFENARSLQEEVERLQVEVERLREKIARGDGRTTDLCVLLEDQQAANRKLAETAVRLEDEIDMVNSNYKSAKSELDAFKNAVREIRNEATQTSGRVSQKYLNSDNSDVLIQIAKTEFPE